MSIRFPENLTAHHDGSERHLSNPNPDLGEEVEAFVRIPKSVDVSTVVLRQMQDGSPFETEATLDRDTETEQWWRAPLVARNPLTSYRFRLLNGSGETRWLNGDGVHAWDVPDSNDFRISTDHQPPAWVSSTTWYQVFPDRFARSSHGDIEGTLPAWASASEWSDPVATDPHGSMTQIYGGTLDGISDHLDHLVDLGIGGLYLCPFFPSRSNHRYDASTFDSVDPLLGGDDALRRLVARARDAGIRVMGDLTTNHSGDHHQWFTDAVSDEHAPSRPFYSWRPDGSYEAWFGIPSLPKFDHTAAELRAALYEGPDSVAGRFLGEEFGLAAMRIDVANMTGRLGRTDLNRRCAEGLRETMRAVRPDAWLLAEYTNDPSADLDGGGWHGSMNYGGFARPVWGWLQRDDIEVMTPGEPGPMPRRSGHAAARSAQAFMAQIPYSVALMNMNLLCTHDTPRWAHAAGSPARNAVGVAMLATWPGTPCIFYGDEIGLGADSTWDVTARLPFPWDDRSAWDSTLLDVYRTLLRLRSTSTALAVGGMRWVSVGDDHLVYLRESSEESILVHVSRGDHEPVTLRLADLGDVVGAEVLAGAEATIRDGIVRLDASGPTWRVLSLKRGATG